PLPTAWQGGFQGTVTLTPPDTSTLRIRVSPSSDFTKAIVCGHLGFRGGHEGRPYRYCQARLASIIAIARSIALQKRLSVGDAAAVSEMVVTVRGKRIAAMGI